MPRITKEMQREHDNFLALDEKYYTSTDSPLHHDNRCYICRMRQVEIEAMNVYGVDQILMEPQYGFAVPGTVDIFTTKNWRTGRQCVYVAAHWNFNSYTAYATLHAEDVQVVTR